MVTCDWQGCKRKAQVHNILVTWNDTEKRTVRLHYYLCFAHSRNNVIIHVCKEACCIVSGTANADELIKGLQVATLVPPEVEQWLMDGIKETFRETLKNSH
jgi:hypothetical protein